MIKLREVKEKHKEFFYFAFTDTRLSRPLSLSQLEVRDAQRRLSENEGAAVELHKRALAAEQAVLVSPLYRKSIALIRSLSRRRSKQRPWRRQQRQNTKRRCDYVRLCEKHNTFFNQRIFSQFIMFVKLSRRMIQTCS